MASLNFKGKSAVWNHHLSVPYHTLEKDDKKSLKGENEGENLIIQGDNLLALKSLLPKYQGKIKCIYIDPPYNTGNEGWVYSDNVSSPVIKSWLGHVVGREGEDLTRHDKWLCMMTPRLKLLKELLAEDGVIFMSIDDNEVHNSRVLLDELFGNQNWVGTIVWKNVTDNNPTNISLEHEYIHCYAKDKTQIEKVWKSKVSDVKDLLVKVGRDLNKKHKNQEALSKAYQSWFRENKAYLWPLDRYKHIDEGGVYTGSQSVHNPGREGYRYDVIHPVTGKPCKQPLMGYRFPEQTMNELIANDKILYGEDDGKIIELKLYAHEYQDKLPSVINYDGRLGAYELRDLFPEDDKLFDNLKPVELVKQLVSFVADEGDIVLDAFAGSGTTAQAVLDLNLTDSKNRRFILVQLPEKIETKSAAYKAGFRWIHEITRERVLRFIKKKDVKSGFTYQNLGPAIDAETILSGKLPTFNEFAKYVFYLATGLNHPKEKDIKEKTFFAGKDQTQSIYLLYKPDLDQLKGMAVTLDWAQEIHKKDSGKKIVYAPACYLEDEMLDEYNITFVSIPYNLFERTK